ncbi:MAG TPA: hypothetical protein VFP59_19850 [Candidatus Angelobacter sp.]|nr:hypothetical protein [Candidatus Angelobacter sp.]
MSTQPLSSFETTTAKPFATDGTEEHRREPQGSTDRSVCATQSEFKSLLDEPWKVTLVPEPPRLPPGVLPAPEPHTPKSLPWRRGDVARLKDDSPRGMMEYIATHTNGWWQELAERALRDNEKAERLVREQGWQPGQYWSLEVDAEAKQKLLDAEEAKRQREEAERATEAAEKEAFMQRQMELLKKAGRAPRCEYVYTDGRGCRAPQVKGERWCHGHAKAMSYRPEKLEMELMEDEQAVMVNLYRVTRSLLAGTISEKTAGLMLWSVAIGMPGAKKVSRELTRMKQKAHHGGAETRRKSKSLPPIDADDRGSGKKQLANGNWPLGKPEMQRNGTNGGEKKVSRELTRNELTRKKTNECDAHSGVTQRKSFKSGVGCRVAPAIAEIARDRTTSPGSEERNHKGAGSKEGRVIAEGEQFSVSPRLRGEKPTSNHKGAQSSGSEWFRENASNRHGQDQHSRGPSTSPHSPSTGSGSLGVGRDDSGKGRRHTASDVDAAEKGHSSASPRLRGEKSSSSHKDRESSSSIRVHPRRSAVGSCSSPASPCPGSPMRPVLPQRGGCRW